MNSGGFRVVLSEGQSRGSVRRAPVDLDAPELRSGGTARLEPPREPHARVAAGQIDPGLISLDGGTARNAGPTADAEARLSPLGVDTEGFSGADLATLVDETARPALARQVEKGGGMTVGLSKADMRGAFRRMKTARAALNADHIDDLAGAVG